jgi:phage baseplate assembly protein W
MPGFGTAPAGTSGAGLGVPVTASAPPDGPAGSRFIDPVTKDYAIDTSTGQLQQMPPTRQRVLIILTTEIGSATTLPTLGVKWPRKMGDTYAAQVKNAVTAALYQLTEVEKVIRLKDVIVEKGRGGRSRITVVWTDLSTNREDQQAFRG